MEIDECGAERGHGWKTEIKSKVSKWASGADLEGGRPHQLPGPASAPASIQIKIHISTSMQCAPRPGAGKQ